MKKGSTVFLQVVIVLIGFIALALLLWEPRVEGVNASASSLYQIYFDDPFLAYIYFAFLPFFYALYQAFRLLGYIARNEVFSQQSVKALRMIKYCGIALAGLIAAPVVYLFIVRPGDDMAGGVAIGLMIVFLSAVVATAAAVFERLLQTAVDIKSENELTI